MYRLVTLAEAKDHLGLLDTEDDARVDRLVLDASQIVMDYCNANHEGWTDTDGAPLTDTNGDPLRLDATVDTAGNLVLDTDGNAVNPGQSIIPGQVRAATLLVIGRLDDDREGKEDPLSPAAKTLLVAYHDPGMA